MRVFIGIPSAGNPAKPFLESIARLEIPPAVVTAGHATVTGNFAPGQRELIVRKALEAQADAVLMLDDDIVVPPSALAELLGVLERDPQCAVAGALYYARDGLRPMVAANWHANDTTSAYVPAFDDRTPVEVDAVGFGTMLLRTSALQALAPPYFNTQVFVQSSASQVRVCNEDYLLCERLRKAGHRVVLHPGVRCGHYDRESGITFPQRWEEPGATNRPRMMVAVNGVPELHAYDALVAAGREVHEIGTLDYLIVD